jgi:hypothetical protein
LLVRTALETAVLQILSSVINAVQASNVNHKRDHEIGVDAKMTGKFAYPICSSRKNLEIG